MICAYFEQRCSFVVNSIPTIRERSTVVRLLSAEVLLCLFCGSLFAGCGGKDSTSDTIRIGTANQAGQGFKCRNYVDRAGDRHNYVVFVPHSATRDAKLPVLLFLNGFLENGDDGIRQIGNNFGIQVWEMQSHFPFLAVCPQCRIGGSWAAESLDTKWALEILDGVIDEYNGDRDRVYLTGVSIAGAGVWDIGSSFPDRFAAIVPLCGSGKFDVSRLANARMPMWTFCNDGDRPELVTQLQRNRAEMVRAGLSPLLTLYHAPEHDCWNAAYRNMTLYRWLLDHRRTGNLSFELFDYMTPRRLIQEWTHSGSSSWSILDDDVLAGRGDNIENSLTSDVLAAPFELHGDVWLPAGSVRQMMLYCEVPTKHESNYFLEILLSKEDSQVIVRSAGEKQLVLIDPAAQHWMQPDGWNDVRLRVADERLSVVLNGWPAFEINMEVGNGKSSNYRVGLVASVDGATTRWRFLRTRLM